MGKATVFRPTRGTGAVLIFISIPLIAFCVLGILAIGQESVWFFGTGILVISVVGLGGGWGILTMRTTVSAWGITKKLGFKVEFSTPWNDIECWVAGRYQEHRVAKFYIPGRRWPAWVWEGDAWLPGFDQFLEAVRFHAREKERVEVDTPR